MPLTKKQKQVVMQGYSDLLKKSQGVALILTKGLPVNDSNALRMNLSETDALLRAVKKRIFLKSANEQGFDDSTGLEKVDGVIYALYTFEDEYGPLREVHNLSKDLKKRKVKNVDITYLGGRYEGKWKDSSYVEAMATLPSKEELVSKFLFLLKYPVQSFTTVLDKIREKKDS